MYLRFVYVVLLWVFWILGHRRGFDRGVSYTRRLMVARDMEMARSAARTVTGSSSHVLIHCHESLPVLDPNTLNSIAAWRARGERGNG